MAAKALPDKMLLVIADQDGAQFLFVSRSTVGSMHIRPGFTKDANFKWRIH